MTLLLKKIKYHKNYCVIHNNDRITSAAQKNYGHHCDHRIFLFLNTLMKAFWRQWHNLEPRYNLGLSVTSTATQYPIILSQLLKVEISRHRLRSNKCRIFTHTKNFLGSNILKVNNSNPTDCSSDWLTVALNLWPIVKYCNVGLA